MKPRIKTVKRVAEAREMVDIESVTPDPANVRTHPQDQITKLMAALKRFGQQTPIVVDTDGVVRKGNGTLLSAKALGWEQIWITRSNLRGAEAAAYAISDNRTALDAEWDEAALAKMLAEPDILAGDAAALGFDDDEVAKIIEAANAADAAAAATSAGTGAGVVVGASYQVLVECAGETEQRALYERLSKEGMQCKVLTL